MDIESLKRYLYTVLSRINNLSDGDMYFTLSDIIFVNTLPSPSPATVGKIYIVMSSDNTTGNIYFTKTENDRFVWVTGIAGPQGELGNNEDINQDSNGKLQFANRAYNSQNPNGMGYKILRKNASFASQVTDTNTIYEIRYDFNLGNTTVTIPFGCVLKFNGGKIINGTINCNGCYLDAPSNSFILSVNIGTIPANKNVYSAWFGFSTTNPDADILSSLLQVGLNVIVNSGVYTLTKTIKKTSTTLTKITGETKQREITELSFGGCDGFDVKNIEISNFRISGDNAHNGIIINGSSVIIKDNLITQFAIGIYRSGASSSIMCTIEGNTISYCTDTGIYVQGSSSGYTGEYNILRNYISKCGTDANNISSNGTEGYGYGVVVGGVNLFVFRYNVVEYCTCYGVFINPKYVTKGLDIEQNAFEQNKRSQIAIKAETKNITGLIVNNCVSTYPSTKVSNFIKEYYYDGDGENIIYNNVIGAYGYNQFFKITPEHPIGYNAAVSALYMNKIPGSNAIADSGRFFQWNADNRNLAELHICYLHKGETAIIDIVVSLKTGSASSYYTVIKHGSQTYTLARAYSSRDWHNVVRITAAVDGYVTMNGTYAGTPSADFDYQINPIVIKGNPYYNVPTSDRGLIQPCNFAGLEIFDSTLGKKIMWDGTAWVNVDGSALS